MSIGIGSKVRIIGPDRYGTHNDTETFTVRMQWRDKVQDYFSDGDLPWYPESSLELADDELKIGDEVKIVGPAQNGCVACIGDKFVVERARDGLYDSKGHIWYPASSLRKVNKQPDPKTLKDLDEFYTKELNKIDTWLDEQKAANDKRCHEAERRLTSLEDFARETDRHIKFIEKWQMEHDLEKTSRFSSIFIDGNALSKDKWHSVVCSTEDEPIKPGDQCEVISGGKFKGKIIRVESIDDVCGQILADGVWFYHKSLRKVEPIKAENWVEVVAKGYEDTGKVFKVVEVLAGAFSDEKGYTDIPGRKHWRAKHLRVLSDAEIAKKLNEVRT